MRTFKTFYIYSGTLSKKTNLRRSWTVSINLGLGLRNDSGGNYLSKDNETIVGKDQQKKEYCKERENADSLSNVSVSIR